MKLRNTRTVHSTSLLFLACTHILVLLTCAYSRLKPASSYRMVLLGTSRYSYSCQILGTYLLRPRPVPGGGGITGEATNVEAPNLRRQQGVLKRNAENFLKIVFTYILKLELAQSQVVHPPQVRSGRGLTFCIISAY